MSVYEASAGRGVLQPSVPVLIYFFLVLATSATEQRNRYRLTSAHPADFPNSDSFLKTRLFCKSMRGFGLTTCHMLSPDPID